MRSRHAIALRCLVVWSGLVALGPSALAAGADAAGIKQAADCLPADLTAVLVLREGDQQLTAIRKISEGPAIQESAGYKALITNPDLVKGKLFAAGLAAAAGSDLWSAGGALLGKDLAIGVAANEQAGQPRFIAVSVARDTALVGRILTQIHAVTGLEVNGQPDAKRSRQIDRVTVFSANPQLHHCYTDGVLMVSNHADLLADALAAAKSGRNRLSAGKTYRDALADVPQNAVAFACGDMARVRQLIGKGQPLPEQLPNALGGLMFGGWWHTLANAQQAVLWITAEGDSIALNGKVTSAKALPPTHRGFVPAGIVHDSWSAEQLPGFLAEVSVTRGWAELFAERESLLTLPAAGDLVNFSSTLTTLMGQLDFVNDLLPNVSGPVRLIAARQNFDGKNVAPTPKLPAFAMVIPFKRVEEMGLTRRLQTASQMAISFLNFDAAQKNQPAYLIENQRVGEHMLLTTTFADAPMRMSGDAKEAMPATQPGMTGVRFNFAPGAAVVGDRYVIATSTDLLRNVVDMISKAGKPAADAKGAQDSLTINGRELTAILADNRAELVTNNMLEKDHSRAQAEGEIDGLLGLLKFADRLDMTSSTGEKSARVSIKLTFRGIR